MAKQFGRTLVLSSIVVLLTACGGGGGGGSSVPPPNTPPTASFTAAPASGTAPLTVQFDASTSSDPGGSITGYSWNFGDNSATATGGAASHVYATPGTFTVTLTVTDNAGATNAATRQVTVAAVVNAAVGGIWKGTTVITGQGTFGLTGLVTEDGRGHFIQDDGVQYWGTVRSSGNNVSASFSAAALIGSTFPDGSTGGTGTLSGTIQARSVLSGIVTFTTARGSQVNSAISLQYNPLYERDSSLAAVAGTYTDSAAPGSDTMTIASDGTVAIRVAGTSCAVNGRIAVVNPEYNAYELQYTFSGCAGTSLAALNGATFNGIATLDNTVVPESLFAGSHGQAGAVTLAHGFRYQRVSLPPANSPPTTSFVAMPASGPAPVTVQFDASTSRDPDGSIVDYSWNFGDGSPAGTGVMTSHVFQTAGAFTITLTVTDNQGATSIASRMVTVSAPSTAAGVMPSVVGMTQAAATAGIAAAEINLSYMLYAQNAAVPAGSVISQDPAPGTAVSPGTLVRIIVSTGATGGERPLIVASLSKPVVGGFVPDVAAIAVSVTSTYEVSSVIASAGGRQVNLTFTAGSGFSGTLSLVGVGTGGLPLTIRTTDARGNVDEFTVRVVHDNPPQLTVSAPISYSMALPSILVDASCSDDGALTCAIDVSATSTPPIAEALLTQGSGRVYGKVDLSRWMPSGGIWLIFVARDDAGQRVEVDRWVQVENPARLTIISEVPGIILDADASRLLFVASADTGDRVGIYRRDNLQTEYLPLPAGAVITGTALLTPTGAIVVARPGGATVLKSHVYLWRTGTLIDLGNADSSYSLAVSGRNAIWNDARNLYRLNTDGGTATLVSNVTINTANAVADDGTVVFGTTSYQIVRDLGGQQTALTNDTTHWHTYPVTDGVNVVYRRLDVTSRQYELILSSGTTSTTLTAVRGQDMDLQPGKDYQAVNGWIAYTDLGAQLQLQVFTRSPQGTTVRHTDFGNSSRVDRLAGNGELMILNGTQRYFSRGTGVLPVSSTWGHSYWINGTWYLGIGRALLRVDTGP